MVYFFATALASLFILVVLIGVSFWREGRREQHKKS